MLFHKLHNSLNTFVPLSLVMRIHKFVVCEGISVCHTFSLSLSLSLSRSFERGPRNEEKFRCLPQAVAAPQAL
jgi:hypothetical protein